MEPGPRAGGGGGRGHRHHRPHPRRVLRLLQAPPQEAVQTGEGKGRKNEYIIDNPHYYDCDSLFIFFIPFGSKSLI